jgi:hypothetical protein
MKKVNLDEGIFGEGQSKSEDKKDKSKKTDKKSKKNKGEDFFDYSNKNGIELNLQYEDKAHQRDEKKFTKTQEPQQIKKTNPNPRAPYQKTSEGKFSDQPQEGRKFYNKGGYQKKPFQFKKNFKTGNNKFDQCNMHLSKMMPMMQPLYNPYTLHGSMMQPQYVPNMMPNMNMGYQTPAAQLFPLPDIVDASDKNITDFLEAYLSLENLNQDLYLRNRIDENGFIEASEIANHNKLRSRGVTAERIAQILGSYTSPVVEAVPAEEGLYLRNRDWENLKDKLMPREYIQQQKKMLKSQQYMNMNLSAHHPMNPVNPVNPMNMNYVSMQNNYFFNGMPNTPENFGMYGMNPGAMAYHHPMMPQGAIPSGNVEQLNTEEKH